MAPRTPLEPPSAVRRLGVGFTRFGLLVMALLISAFVLAVVGAEVPFLIGVGFWAALFVWLAGPWLLIVAFALVVGGAAVLALLGPRRSA